MNRLSISTVSVAIGFAYSAGAMAQVMSKEEYKSHKESIAVDARPAKAGCDSFSVNAKDSCIANAKARYGGT